MHSALRRVFSFFTFGPGLKSIMKSFQESTGFQFWTLVDLLLILLFCLSLHRHAEVIHLCTVYALYCSQSNHVSLVWA
ncbi:hypothetical protein GYMLUDRAFT_646826 [Collybiopsis luxurians FD-317 M1]|nr:hypothetical protein GYMLUDRAFT_646826 [Collybiopsis luxurians FD-317 M1]